MGAPNGNESLPNPRRDGTSRLAPLTVVLATVTYFAFVAYGTPGLSLPVLLESIRGICLLGSIVMGLSALARPKLLHRRVLLFVVPVLAVCLGLDLLIDFFWLAVVDVERMARPLLSELEIAEGMRKYYLKIAMGVASFGFYLVTFILLFRSRPQKSIPPPSSPV